MTNSTPATLAAWLPYPADAQVAQSIDRLRRSDDVRHVALMPDLHLANDVCIGAVIATEQLIYPAAIGGDIGCGIVTLAFDADVSLIDHADAAARVLAGLYECVPGNKHHKPRDLPTSLSARVLTNERLQRLANRDGRVQLGTLGRGNHFLEFQADLEGRLWVMIHSGSRAVGQAITAHHLEQAIPARSGLKYLDAATDAGLAYLADACWARDYANENRVAMLLAVSELVHRLFGIAADWSTLIHCDHNHVRQEVHHGKLLWTHRKGAQPANSGEFGVVPGSMGTPSFHTIGQGCAEALMSCSHGAGRALSRTEARQAIGGREFARQVGKLWYDHRHVGRLRDEAPSAYKEIRQVMKAQRELIKIVREVRPILTYKSV